MILPFSKKSKEIKKAEELIRQKKLKDAEKIFREYRNIKGLRKVAHLYFKDFKYKKALSIYEEIEDRDGTLKVLNAFKERGNIGEVMKVLGELLKKDDGYSQLVEEFGEDFLKRGELLKAEKIFSFYEKSDREKKLSKIFDIYLGKGDLSNSIRIARDLGDNEKLKKIGYTYLEKDEFNMSKKIFNEIGYTEGVNEVEKREEEFNRSKK